MDNRLESRKLISLSAASARSLVEGEKDFIVRTVEAISSTQTFSVRLAKSGFPESHGLLGFLLSQWNPGVVYCEVIEKDGDCEVSIQTCGTFTHVETVAATVLGLLLLGIFVWYSTTHGVHNPLHWCAVVLPISLPLMVWQVRKEQDRKLQDYVLAKLQCDSDAK